MIGNFKIWFGKHIGKKFYDLPIEYLEWLFSNYKGRTYPVDTMSYYLRFEKALINDEINFRLYEGEIIENYQFINS